MPKTKFEQDNSSNTTFITLEEADAFVREQFAAALESKSLSKSWDEAAQWINKYSEALSETTTDPIFVGRNISGKDVLNSMVWVYTNREENDLLTWFWSKLKSKLKYVNGKQKISTVLLQDEVIPKYINFVRNRAIFWVTFDKIVHDLKQLPEVKSAIADTAAGVRDDSLTGYMSIWRLLPTDNTNKIPIEVEFKLATYNDLTELDPHQIKTHKFYTVVKYGISTKTRNQVQFSNDTLADLKFLDALIEMIYRKDI